MRQEGMGLPGSNTGPSAVGGLPDGGGGSMGLGNNGDAGGSNNSAIGREPDGTDGAVHIHQSGGGSANVTTIRQSAPPRPPAVQAVKSTPSQRNLGRGGPTVWAYLVAMLVTLILLYLFLRNS
jgi:hypothetical protein